MTINEPYHFADIHPQGVVISHNFKLKIIDLNQKQFEMGIPVRKVRFGGVVPSRKKYWFGVGDGCIVFVYRLFGGNDKYALNSEMKFNKTVIKKKMGRVYQILQPTKYLSLVGIDFK